MIFFCPYCWKEIKEDDKRCPYCGADITDHERKGFEEKLINALRHPEQETVQRAVWILGKIKSVKSVSHLIGLFEKNDNPFLKVEILNALDEIEIPEAMDFIIEELDSDISMVRRKAKELIERKMRTNAGL